MVTERITKFSLPPVRAKPLSKKKQARSMQAGVNTHIGNIFP